MHRSIHLNKFWEQGVLEISHTKKKVGKNLGNFLENYI